MLRGRMFRFPLLPVALVLLAIGCIAFWADNERGALAQGMNAMAVDVDPETEVVDVSATRGLGETFEVSVNITQAEIPYSGYQANVRFDPDVLAYDDPPGVTYMGLGGTVLDATPMVEADRVCAGSTRISGTTAATGQAHRVGFRCIAEGTTPLHLLRLGEDFVCPSTTGGEDGVHILTAIIEDPFVTCSACPHPGDTDCDGCADSEETWPNEPPRPGATGSYDPVDPYDFYDVPIPAQPDPTPNGTRNQAVAMDDALGVLFYVGTYDGDGGSANANGVAYDSVKNSCNADGDAILDKEGLCYDRSASAEPNPPWNAGPPDGAVSMEDVLAVLAQVGLDCGGPPTPTPTITPTPTVTPTPTATPTATPTPNPAAIDAVIQATADLLGVPPGSVEVVSVEPHMWPDSCLGLGQPGEVCSLILTPGYRITVAVGSSTLIWRTDANGWEVRLEDML